MTHASLCTGIGACEIAATWLGWDNAFSCEINEFCRRVLKYHYPNSKHYENIFGTDFTGWRGEIDVLTAGFPCQPFSCAGSRKGAEDDRYLWPEVLRVIQEVRPTWFVGENVAGITSMVLPGNEIGVGSYKDIFGESYQETEMRQQFVTERICRDLESIGYSVQPVAIPACAVEAPHKRERIWFIANANGSRFQAKRSKQSTERITGYCRITTDTNGERCNNRGYFWKERQFCLDKERYTKKNKSERTKRKYWISKNGKTFTNSTSKGLENRFRFKGWANEKEDGARVDCEHKRHGRHEYASNANKFNGNISRFCTGKFSRQQTTGIFENIPNWRNFPSQPPVCSRDDGISSQLSGISFRRWREESVKAFGNSMVPQVVYQIFKAIEESE